MDKSPELFKVVASLISEMKLLRQTISSLNQSLMQMCSRTCQIRSRLPNLQSTCKDPMSKYFKSNISSLIVHLIDSTTYRLSNKFPNLKVSFNSTQPIIMPHSTLSPFILIYLIVLALAKSGEHLHGIKQRNQRSQPAREKSAPHKNVLKSDVHSSYEFWRLGSRVNQQNILAKFNKSQNDFRKREPVTAVQYRNVRTPNNIHNFQR